MGKEIKGGEKRKKRKFGENIIFGSTKLCILTRKTQFNTIQILITLFHCLMGKKFIDYKTRRNALRGRKSKAGGGGEIKSDSIICILAFK